MKTTIHNLHEATNGTVWIETRYHLAGPFGPGQFDMRLSGRFEEKLTLDQRIELLCAAATELMARIPGLSEQRPELDKADFLRQTDGHGCLWFKLPPTIYTQPLTAIDAAHDRVSALIEDPYSSTEELRDAVVGLCEALNVLHEQRAAGTPPK